MTRIAAMERERSGYVTLDDILRDITTAKEEVNAVWATKAYATCTTVDFPDDTCRLQNVNDK